MEGLNKENFFFFYNDCSGIKIIPNSIEHAYLAILNEELKTAEAVFKKNDSPRANWGQSLVTILQGYMTTYPSYFGIRNFLEIDLDFLLKNNKIDYVEQCLGSLEILSTINQETYKYTARVMLENNLFSAGIRYLDKSKKIYFNDPELHFMYASYYMNKKQYDDAYHYISECLKLLPSYYPAIQMKEKIEEINF